MRNSSARTPLLPALISSQQAQCNLLKSRNLPNLLLASKSMKMTSPHRIQVEFRPRISNNNLLNPLRLAAEAAILNAYSPHNKPSIDTATAAVVSAGRAQQFLTGSKSQLLQVPRLLGARALWDWQEHHHEEHVRRRTAGCHQFHCTCQSCRDGTSYKSHIVLHEKCSP